MEYFIKGNVRRIIYNSDTGYIVGVFKVVDHSEELEVSTSMSFTGYFHELNYDDTYIFYGDIVNHPKYGTQFSVTRYDRVMPEEKDSIADFLSSDMFKGVGHKTAEKIVEVLGKDALKIILENPENLLLIPGIKKKTIDTLHNTLLTYESSYNTILTLNELGFSTRESLIIYNKYKMNTNEVINSDLYKIYFDIRDITFRKVDSVALKKDYDRLDKRRVKATILYAMSELCNTIGHTYLSLEDIYKYTIISLGNNLDSEEFKSSLDQLIVDIKIIRDDDKYYLYDMWMSENNIVNRISYLTRKKDLEIKNLDKFINQIEKDHNIIYNDEQIEAMKSSLLKNFLIITGGPGTGKTTILQGVVDLYKEVYKLGYEDLKEEMVLLAPTGRASKRLKEQTHLPASTIHSFLKWNKDQDKFAINERNKSDVKFVIVDEASMIDVPLFNSLLCGLKLDTRIIMVGDYNQLPSVGPGELLKELINANVLPVITLKTLYRQKENSNIITLAHDINEGLVNKQIFNVSDDLTLINTNDIINNIYNISKEYLEKDYHEFEVLAPMYKGINGIDNINLMLQSLFNPKSPDKNEIVIGDTKYREGDKVLQLINMPDDKIYNGDIGKIVSISKKEISVLFDDNEVIYTPATYSNFKLGYAISIHKSQGSEFDTVVIPICSSYTRMLYRKLYYTAITRAKRKIILVGDLNSLQVAALNNLQDIRKTSIKDKMIKEIG